VYGELIVGGNLGALWEGETAGQTAEFFTIKLYNDPKF
jgi:hypothetical protein